MPGFIVRLDPVESPPGCTLTVRCLSCGAEHTETVRSYTPPSDPGALTLAPGVVVTSTPTPDQDAP